MRLRNPASTASSPDFCQRTEMLVVGAIFLSLLGGCGAPAAPSPQAPMAAEAPLAPVPAPAQEPRPEVASPSTEATSSVEVVGIYEQLNVAQKAGAPPNYVGRATVRKEDGRTVMLETHDRGVRTAEEIAAFEGKRVKVEAARADDRCLAWGNGTQAAIVGPCLRGIVHISLASP